MARLLQEQFNEEEMARLLQEQFNEEDWTRQMTMVRVESEINNLG